MIASPKVVFIFWGPNFSNAASPDHTIAVTLQAYRNQLGSTPEWKTLQQYGVTWPTNLGSGTPDWFDTLTILLGWPWHLQLQHGLCGPDPEDLLFVERHKHLVRWTQAGVLCLSR